MKKLIFAAALMFLVFVWASSAQAATLSLSPSSGSNSVGNIFTVTILLNTQSQAVDGVDIRYLNYSPTLLEVQDENTSQAGVQISAGTLFGNTVANSVDTTNGRISFSQVAAGGATYSNAANATLATMRFKVLTTGTAPVTFSFTSGSTADTNVAAGGSDVLTSVTNGSYTLTVAPDTQAPTAPSILTAIAVSSSKINLSWVASTDNVGVAGYRIYRGGTQIDTSASNSYSNTGLSPSTTYTYTVAAYDTAGNVSGQSSPASATTQAPADTTSPTTPTNLLATAVSSSQINLSWTASTDNVGVVGYHIYRNSVEIATITATSYQNTGLTPSISYTYEVSAYDAAGNGSFASTPVTATTWPSTSNKFSINNRIKTAGILNVRQTPSSSGTLLGNQPFGSLGTVIGGSTYADGYWWWQINYDIDPDGWSIESGMDLPPMISGAVFTPALEGVTNINAIGFTFNLYNVILAGNQAQFTALGNASNQVILPSTVTNLREDRYNVYVKSVGYLKAKIADTRIASSATVSLSVLKAGDLNDDGIINSLDWSSMNSKWFTNDITSDVNRDGIVNTIDFSWMNKNWLQADAI